PAWAQDGRVDEVLAVGGADDDDVLEAFDAVDLGQELGHDGGLDVGGDAGAAGAEERVHLVEEDDDRDVLGGLFLGLDEDLADLALGLPDVLVEELGALDVEEEALDLLAALLGDHADPVFVGAERDEGALGVALLLEDDVLALDLVAGGLDDVEAFVEDELLAGLERLGLDRGMQVDLHLAALREDGDGVVLV